MKCSACGSDLGAMAKFCAECGKEIERTVLTDQLEDISLVELQGSEEGTVQESSGSLKDTGFWPESKDWPVVVVLFCIPLITVVLVFLSQWRSNPGQGNFLPQKTLSSKSYTIDDIKVEGNLLDGSASRWTAFQHVYDSVLRGEGQTRKSDFEEVYVAFRQKHERLNKQIKLESEKNLLANLAADLKSGALSIDEIDQRIQVIKSGVLSASLASNKDAVIREGRKTQKALRIKAESARQLAVKEEGKRLRALMGEFEGTGTVMVAVLQTKISRSLFDYSFSGDGRFVSLYVAVLNNGDDTVHANPNNFTLATTAGTTSSYSSMSFQYSKSFEAVNLSPGQSTSGWIVFETVKDSRYLLTHRFFGDVDVEKTIIP